MPRYKLTIEYDGTDYYGWQFQEDGPSIQLSLSNAIYGFCGQKIIPNGAGRTDSGVHALGQVAHVDLAEDWDPFKVMEAVNYHLKPEPIAIISAEKVSDDFDARFSAKKRFYTYKIINRRARLAIDHNRAWQVWRPLDEKAMQQAANHLLGKHDFTTFRSSKCQSKSPVKSIDEAIMTRQGDRLFFHIHAQSFMHHQVRSIIGSLVEVGTGKWSPQDFKAVLEAKDRSLCGPVAPSCGLYFVKVQY